MSRPLSRTTTIFAALAAAALLAVGAFSLGRRSAPPAGAAEAAVAASAPRQVLYWHDPMTPGPRFDKPGKSPFMDMDLVPVYADEAAGQGAEAGVQISPAVQQNLGLRTATVQRAERTASFDAVGTVQFDERLAVAVQSRVAGFVEHLAVRAPMERVRPGQALATVYAPDWLGPLNELLALQHAGAAPELVAAARERTRALSIPPELVRQAEATGVAQARFTLTAPAGGVVAELGVREGMAVSPGMTLFRIAGLGQVWAMAEVPEAQAVRLVRGQKVRAALQADPSLAFDGTLAEVLPQVNPATRTVQARFDVDNRAGRLVPGMLLRLQVAGPLGSRLLVPAEAVIHTGTRAVAIVRGAGGRFAPRELKLGAELGEEIEVLEGLAAGDEVVTSGQFLVDSEARLHSVLANMAGQGAASQVSQTSRGGAR